MRIQGREIAFKTQKPAGLFALCWRRIRDGIFSKEDEAVFRAVWNYPDERFVYFDGKIDSVKEAIAML